MRFRIIQTSRSMEKQMLTFFKHNNFLVVAIIVTLIASAYLITDRYSIVTTDTYAFKLDKWTGKVTSCRHGYTKEC